MNRFITGLNILLVILVAIGSFVLSYSALSDLASNNGFAGWRAYVLPLVIDVGMLAFGLAVVHAHLHGTNPLRRRGLNLLYIIATVSFNIVHAPNNLLAQTLAALPPVTLFFTFEVLMAMIEHNIKQRQGEEAGGQRVSREPEEAHAIDLVPAHNEKDSSSPELRPDKVLSLSGQGMTQQQIADELSVSLATVKRDLKSLNGKVKSNQP